MPSELHEAIVEEVSTTLTIYNWKYFPDAEIGDGLFGSFERFPLFTSLAPLRGDFYFGHLDSHGPIVVEVGKNRPDKWNGFTCQDGKPIRVLRITFDRAAGLLNARGSKQEKRFLECVHAALRGETAAPIAEEWYRRRKEAIQLRLDFDGEAI